MTETILEKLKTLRQYNRYDGEYGIEIETEAKTPYDVPQFKYWRAEQDGSLRDFGIEYILKQPLKMKDQIPDALDEFKEKTKSFKLIPDSHSTSVHVHVNFLNDTFRTLGNFFTVYSLVENLLIKYAGSDRDGNLFCLPIYDAQITCNNIIKMMQYVERKNYAGIRFPSDEVKYAALGIGCLYDYGSIELRQMRGDPTPERIMEWLSIIHAMMEFSRRNLNPRTIMEGFRVAPTKFIENLFGDTMGVIARPDMEELIQRNLFFAIRIATSVKDWDTLDKTITLDKNAYTMTNLDKYAQAFFSMHWNDLAAPNQQLVLQMMRERGVKYKSGYVDPNMVEAAPANTFLEQLANAGNAGNHTHGIVPAAGQPIPGGQMAAWIAEQDQPVVDNEDF